MTRIEMWQPLYSQWHLLTTDRLLVLNLYTYILNNVKVFCLEMSCLHGFHKLTSWSLTSTKNNRLVLLYVVYVHTKYEVGLSFPSWDMFTRFSQLTPVDSHVTSTKTNRLPVINVVHCDTPTQQIWDLSKLAFLRYSVYKLGITTHTNTRMIAKAKTVSINCEPLYQWPQWKRFNLS